MNWKMNSRILQSIWKLQRSSILSNKINTAAVFERSYAIEIRKPTGLGAYVTEQLVRSMDLNQRMVLIRMFAARADTKFIKPIDVEHQLQFIESDFQRNGIVSYEAVCKLLDTLEGDASSFNQLLSAEQTAFLLSSCGNLMPAQTSELRMQLFQRLWDYLEAHKQLDADHFLAALQVWRINRAKIPDYRALVQQLSNFAPQLVDVTLFEQLVEIACESGNVRQATEILAEMREKQYPLTERVFNALIIGHARSHDLNGCKTVLESMSAANMQLSSETQTLLVCAYLENEQKTLAIDLLKQFRGQFSNAQLLRVLKTATLLPDLDGLELIEHLVNELPVEFLYGPEVPKPIQNICIELVYNGNLETAIALIRILPTPRFNENQNTDTYAAFLLRELFRAQVNATEIIEICEKLIESNQNTRALHIAADLALRRSPPTALPFLEAIGKQEELRTHYFWPLFMYNFRRWGENGIFRTLKIMTSLKVNPDDETISFYVLPRISVTLDSPENALKSFDSVGVKTSAVMTPILSHMLAQQKMDQAYNLAQLYPTKLNCLQLVQPLASLAVHIRATKRYHQYVKLIQVLAKKSDNPKLDFVGQLLLDILASNTRLRNDAMALLRVINELKKFGLQISAQAAEIIGAHFTKNFKEIDSSTLYKTLKEMTNKDLSLPNNTTNNSSGTTSSFITHPRDMSLEELECHLIELESKGLNARGVLRRLLQLCVRDGRLERALEVKQKCDELRVQLSPGMMASIFDMYIKLKDLPSAEESLCRLKKYYPGFQIDEHKIIDFAALLVHEQQLEEGKRILQERANCSKIIGGDYVTKNVWNFLTCVAQLAAKSNLPKEQNLARDNFVFLQKLGYCNSQNAVLGPIVREYLFRNDIHAAVEEFQRIAQQYKRTPLQFELLSLMVRLSNSQEAASTEEIQRFSITDEEAKSLLTTVTEVIKQVHGEINMNSGLLLAFAESGTDQQLRRLLINPEFRINQEMLLKNCEHLGQEGALHTLLRLARCARGLGHVISEQSIYNLLLLNFRESNNYAAALELFERLEADDELKISQEFLKNLVTLLKVNNVEIPSSLALRAQII